MKIQESAQDYLESILILSKKGGTVRAVDICTYFGYARATVSVFLKQLKENGYIAINDKKEISLTKEGREIAEEMYERHTTLTEIFEKIGVPSDIAVKDACRVEHYISATTFRALQEHFNLA